MRYDSLSKLSDWSELSLARQAVSRLPAPDNYILVVVLAWPGSGDTCC